MAIDTKRAISAKFEREDGAIRGRRAISGVVGAYNTASRHATFLGGLDRYQLCGVPAPSLVGYAVRMRGEESSRGLGHRQVGRRRLRCLPRQDDQIAAREL